MTVTQTVPQPALLAPRVIPDLLRRSARLVPDRPAIVLDGERQLTFAELERRSNAAAAGLRARGVRRGDRVTLLFGGTGWLDYAVAYFAVLKVGAVALVAGDRFTDTDLRQMVDRYAVTGLLVPGTTGTAATPGTPGAGAVAGPGRAVPDVGCWVAGVGDLEAGRPDGEVPVDARPEDAAEVVFTSGTTARPRGVEATHANVMRARTAWPTGVRGNQPCVHALPVGSVAAQVVLVDTVGGQNTLVVMSDFDVPRFARLVQQWAAVTVCLVPAMGHWLVRAAAGPARPVGPLPSVKGVSFSGAAVPAGIMPDLPPIFPRAAFYNFYTSTEAYPAKLATRFDPARPESVGLPVGSCEVRITADDGTVLPAGQVGAVWLRAEGAPSRRFLDDDESRVADSTFRDGWTRTGDLGYLDVDGHLCLAGRAGDIVIVGGFNVSTFRVEEVLGRHEAVAEAAVFAADHPVLGEVVAALVVLRSDATVRDLRRHAARHLSRRELPAILRIVDDIPRNQAGKIDKRTLPALLDTDGPAAFAAPRTDSEREIAAVWAQVLDLGSVGVDDNFFEIGGDSLAATQIAAAVRQRLGAEIDAVSVFESPSVAELAARVDEATDERNE